MDLIPAPVAERLIDLSRREGLARGVLIGAALGVLAVAALGAVLAFVFT